MKAQGGGCGDNRSADAELAVLVKRTRLHLVWLLWIVSSTALTDASSKPILQRFWGTGGVQREGGFCAFPLPYTCLSATVFLISSTAFWFFFRISHLSAYIGGFPGGSVGKNPPANAGDVRDVSLIPASRRFPGEGNGNPLQYSCLKYSKDRGTLQAKA